MLDGTGGGCAGRAATSALCSAHARIVGRMKIAADVDTGIDDALALVYLSQWAASAGAELAVTTSAGNCTARQAAANSVEVLRACGTYPEPHGDVTVGAAAPLSVELTTTPETHGPTGLGYHRTRSSAPPRGGASPSGSAGAAVAAWWGAERLLVAGPATNLAHGLAPDVTVMCGAFDYPGNTTATAEWNAWVDPHALSQALSSLRDARVPHRICPLNVTERVLLYPERLDLWCRTLRGQGRSELAGLLEDALRFYFEFHQHVGVGYCAQIHDLAAAMVMLGTVAYRTRPGYVSVALDGELRGTTSVRWASDEVHPEGNHQARGEGEASGCSSGAPMATDIVVELDAEGVFAEFERVVLGIRAGLTP